MAGAYSKYPLYNRGSIVNLQDIVDPTEGTVCTIKAIEQDEEDPSLFYYYLYANDENKNNKTDYRVGRYFEFIEFCNPRIILLSNATMS